MAKVFPSDWEVVGVVGGPNFLRELDTLKALSLALSDDYTIFHAVHWINLNQHSKDTCAEYGEIDFIVVNRAGDVLLIEQKSGFLEEREQGLVKRYQGKEQVVQVHMARTRAAIQAKLFKSLQNEVVQLTSLFYCPDYTIKNPLTAGVSPEHIVDFSTRDQLALTITKLLPVGQPNDRMLKVHRFMSDTLQLVVSASAVLDQARTVITRISGGLAMWGRQLHFSPYRLRITGTAGSGKTQLALAEYRDALAKGKRVLYLCYNRPLADHMAHIVPAGGLCCTFHAFCDRLLQGQGIHTDFTEKDAFSLMIERAARAPVVESFLFDTIIVDEGQDFEEAWRPQIFRHAKAEARLLWLEDPMQNLYNRPVFNEAGWVQITSSTNYRSPRSVVRMLQPLLPEFPNIEAASPFDSSDTEFLTYADSKGLVDQVKEAIRQCLGAGFRKTDIVILSFHGKDKSALALLDRLGPHSLKRQTGRYDLLGSPVYDEGDVLLESVYRFKGQSAPAVILAEVDFESLDEREVRKLFVGTTRAMMKLVVVLSERALKMLREQSS